MSAKVSLFFKNSVKDIVSFINSSKSRSILSIISSNLSKIEKFFQSNLVQLPKFWFLNLDQSPKLWFLNLDQLPKLWFLNFAEWCVSRGSRFSCRFPDETTISSIFPLFWSGFRGMVFTLKKNSNIAMAENGRA